MAKPPKILLSITPHSMTTKTCQMLVETLQVHTDLILTTPQEYDFARNTIACYRYRDGEWQARGRGTPQCDIWIVWIDGYAQDHRSLGFANELAYYGAMQAFFQRNLDNGNVGTMYNPPQTERRTLKDWLAQLDSEAYQLIPSYTLDSFEHLAELHHKLGPLVVKPIWGGFRQGVAKVSNAQELALWRGRDLQRYVAQVFYRGPEKRLWIAGGRCRQGCVFYGRRTPWSDFTEDYRVLPHDWLPAEEQARDIGHANRLAAEAGLYFGAVDFIGDRINEINGGGTGHYMWSPGLESVVDAQPVLQAEILRLIGVQSRIQ